MLIPALGTASHADPKREVPDYDGRGNPDTDADSWTLWIPRVVLSPLYVANEYLLRRPIGAVVRHAERDRWADTIAHLFGFGDGDGDGGHGVLAPTARFDLGLLPQVGFYYSRDDTVAAHNTVRIHAATWGPQWIDATAADRYAIDQADSVQARFELRRTKDNLFLGLGPDVTSATASRYGETRLEGSLGYRRALTGAARLDVESGIRRTSFLEGDCCGDPSLDARIASAELMAPPDYRRAYSTGYARVDVMLDSRHPRPDPGTGVYLHVRGEPSFDLQRARSWLRYGGVLGGALDLTGHRRTLRLQIALDFVDQLGGDSIPFTEDPVLGGELMPGFVTGWMTGRSTAAAQLAYSWPVWLGLDAQTRFTVGNAFGDHLGGLSPAKLRMSGDVGFATSTAYDQGFEILLGVGSETFEQGASITSLRVAIGSRRGF